MAISDEDARRIAKAQSDQRWDDETDSCIGQCLLGLLLTGLLWYADIIDLAKILAVVFGFILVLAVLAKAIMTAVRRLNSISFAHCMPVSLARGRVRTVAFI